MKKYLITGISGFVAYHFLEYLNGLGEEAEVLGLDLKIPQHISDYSFKNVKLSFIELNLLEYRALGIAVVSFNPNYIVHLASFSSVGKSWEMPLESFLNNTNIFLNIAEIVRHNKIACRILSVGSSEEYGNVKENHIPLKENMPLHPRNPYAVARVSQEMLSKCYVDAYGLNIILTRSFNHVGAMQRTDFAIPSFTKQISDGIKQGQKEIKLSTGDLSVIRDFIDVRDVAAAYFALLKNGKTGELYNVCSGKGHSLKEIIDLLAEIFKVKVITETDSKKVRPIDNKIIIGCFEKIKKHTGWQPKFDLENSLKAVVESYAL
ncbi:MAG: GDP-mannose 4,6-dehydratase [Chitinispirillales bacterium]|jgi:GDP-4-dehydro-6-deoxy-D-mannose reductase|nr:GDP-mannose 4,6-dehydratase [Chitinispirillales bacterium]